MTELFCSQARAKVIFKPGPRIAKGGPASISHAGLVHLFKSRRFMCKGALQRRHFYSTKPGPVLAAKKTSAGLMVLAKSRFDCHPHSFRDCKFIKRRQGCAHHRGPHRTEDSRKGRWSAPRRPASTPAIGGQGPQKHP